MNELPNSTDVMSERFGKRECLAHEAGTALTQRVVEALNIGRFARFFTDSLMAFRG